MNNTNIWLSSDWHVFHHKILGYCNRPFSNIEEMNQHLIDEHNKVVKPTDIVYNLGDFCFLKPNKAVEVVKQLNGIHRFIRGNHDTNWLFDTKKNNFNALAEVKQELINQGSNPNKIEWIKDYYEFNLNGTHVCLFHYPIDFFHRSHHGSLHLHGHLHANINKENEESGKRRLDVGVDSAKLILGEYRPFSLKEVEDILHKVPVKRFLDRNNEND